MSRRNVSLRQICKTVLQYTLLPAVYSVSCVINRVDEKKVILADAHHTFVPVSMELMPAACRERGYRVCEHYHDYSRESSLLSLWHAIQFMWSYASARYVFICDYFLPASSCRKRHGTSLIQLFHSCGACKKMGYDAADDIPTGFRGDPFRNYDLMTVSSEELIPVYESGMHLERSVIRPLGVSRTDRYFDSEFLNACRQRFSSAFPSVGGKKVVLWAPTFRGNAARPEQTDPSFIETLREELGEDWTVLVKVHPHVDAYRKSKGEPPLSNSDIPTEELLPVVDVLITDYSSVLNEFMFFDRPIVLFAPDLETFERTRGFYVAYDSLSPYITADPSRVGALVRRAYGEKDSEESRARYDSNRSFHISACDGKSTQRILDYCEREL